MEEMLVFLLVVSGIGDLLKAPPRDLATMIEPKVALEKMEVATDEDSLIKLLKVKTDKGPTKAELLKAIESLKAGDFKARRTAKKLLIAHGWGVNDELQKVASSATDPEQKINAQEVLDRLRLNRREALMEGDDGYVKKILAIQLLGSMKSAKAEPALKAISDQEGGTLADAANHALASIKAKPAPARDAKKGLMDVASRLPGNAGFVAMLDFAADANPLELTSFVKRIKEKPGVKDMGIPMDALDGMLLQGPPMLTKALGMTGNIRVDSVTAFFPNALGLSEESNYVTLVVKGLYEPEKVEHLLNLSMKPAAKHNGRQIFTDRELGICCLDANTFVFMPCDRNDGLAIVDFLKSYTAPPKAKTFEALKKANPIVMSGLEPVLTGKARIAAGGSLSIAQQGLLQREIDKEIGWIKRRKRVDAEGKFELVAMEMFKQIVTVPKFSGSVGKDGTITVSGKPADKEAAELVKKHLDAFDAALVKVLEEAKKEVEGEAVIEKIFDGLLKQKGIFHAVIENGTVTVTNTVEKLTAFPMMLMVKTVEVKKAVRRAPPRRLDVK